MKNLWLFLRFMIVMPTGFVLIAPCVLIGMLAWIICSGVKVGWEAADSLGDDLK